MRKKAKAKKKHGTRDQGVETRDAEASSVTVADQDKPPFESSRRNAQTVPASNCRVNQWEEHCLLG